MEREKYAAPCGIQDLAYLDHPQAGHQDRQQEQRIRAWAHDNSRKRLVNPIFRLLGAENLVLRFQEEKEQNLRPANVTEQYMFQIIWLTLQHIVPDSMSLSEPDLWIGTLQQSELEPFVFTSKKEKHQTAHRSFYKKRYSLDRLVMAEDDFHPDAFDRTFVKTADKLLRVYGSSRSEK